MDFMIAVRLTLNDLDESKKRGFLGKCVKIVGLRKSNDAGTLYKVMDN